MRRAAYAAAGAVLCAMGVTAVRKLRAYYLKDKVVLITGGSRGLGLLLAEEFARQRCRIAICARDPEELERAQALLARNGFAVMTIPCDLTRKEEVSAMLEDVGRQLGPVDVLVNNAGVIQVAPVEEMDLQDYRDSMDAHFWGPLYAILGVLPEMIRRRSGRIVNISSIGGKISVPHLVPYCASKFALVGLSQGLRSELARHRIAVTTVCPGLMRTGSPRNAIFKGKHRAEYTWFSIADGLPLLTISARHAAREIVRACARGDGEIILSLPAKAAAKFNALFPELTMDILEFASRLLPGPGGIGKGRAAGKDSTSRLSPSWLTSLGEEAARAHNEIR